MTSAAPAAAPVPAVPRAAGGARMLAHSGLYFASRLGAGVLGVVGLGVYTRYLTPAEYGVYALAVAGTGLVHAAAFNWLSLGVARFLPGAADRGSVLRTARAVFALLLVLTAVGTAAAYAFWPDPALRPLLPLGVALLWTHAWFELNLEVVRARLAPGRYALATLAKGVLSLGVGVPLAARGWGASGVIVGSVVATLAAGALLAGGGGRGGDGERGGDGGRDGGAGGRVDRALAREMWAYGLPLSLALTASFVVDSSDRFLLAALASPAAAGVYSASYLLAKQSILLLLAPVGLATFPMAVRALAAEGEAGARRELGRSGVLLLAAGVPAAVGMVTLSGNVADTLLGPEFREAGRTVLPWVSAAVFLFGLQQYHFGRAFTLSRRTWGLVVPAAATAVLNFLLNLWWIPAWGIRGAMYSTLAAYVAAIVLTVVLGRRHLRIPVPVGELARVCAAAAVMAAALLPLAPFRGPLVLVGQVAAGAAVYALAALVLDVAGARGVLARWRAAR